MVLLPSVQDIKESDSADVPKHAHYNELNYLIRSDLHYKAKENGNLVYRVWSPATMRNAVPATCLRQPCRNIRRVTGGYGIMARCWSC